MITKGEKKMTDIIKLLKDEEQTRFTKEYMSEHETITDKNISITRQITEKIAEYNATNILLIDIEYQLQKQKMELETSILNLKNSQEYISKYKTLTQRDEQARIECDDYNYKIIELEHTQKILQANIKALNYELRLLFKMLLGDFDGNK